MSNSIQQDMPYFDPERGLYLPSNALDLILKEQALDEDYERLKDIVDSHIVDQDPQYE